MTLDITTTQRIVVLAMFVAYIVAVTLIGFFASRAQKKKAASGDYSSDFFTGGRSLGGLALGMVMMATLLSSGTFVSAHGMIYKIGWSYAIIILVCHFSLLICLGGTGKKIGIVGRRVGAVSFIGLLKNRYNNNNLLAIIMAVPMVVFLLCYSASQVIGGARVFEVMTGGSYWVGLLLFGAVIGLYTLLGGMTSVSAASIFQGFIMVLAVILMVFGYTSYVGDHYGSLSDLVTVLGSAEETQSLLAPAGAFSVKNICSLLFMFAFCGISLPHMSQGNLTYKDTKSLKNACLIGGISSFVVYIALLLVGFVVRVINPELGVSDHVMPFLAFLVLPSPFVGVMLSAVAAAIQSTVAAMMLLVTAAICKDIYKDILKPNATDKQMKVATPITLVVVCVAVLLISIDPPDMVQTIVNFAIGGLAAAFFFPLLLGLYWKRTNEYGAIAGVLSGFIYFIFASTVPAAVFGFNAFVPAMVISGILTVAVSLATPKPPLGLVQVWFGKEYSKEFARR